MTTGSSVDSTAAWVGPMRFRPATNAAIATAVPKTATPTVAAQEAGLFGQCCPPCMKESAKQHTAAVLKTTVEQATASPSMCLRLPIRM